jgi:hypothetical protein
MLDLSVAGDRCHLGTLSIGADWLYHHGQISGPTLVVFSSFSTAIYLPLLTWTINIFLGVGVISWVLVSTFERDVSLDANNSKVPTVQRFSLRGRIPLFEQSAPHRRASTADWKYAMLELLGGQHRTTG